MMQKRITPENTEFVVLSFEGPDSYSMAGGLGMRVSSLTTALARAGYRTHLFFIGDPRSNGLEVRHHGRLILHRWCQWISQYYPSGVYDGEDDKLRDFVESIPPFVRDQVVKSAVSQGKMVVVLAEEWQTAEAVCRLSDILRDDGLRDRVIMLWNANNTYSFDRIDWGRLNNAVTITTVSRYMKHIMWPMGLNPLVIPNGIPKKLLRKTDDAMANSLRKAIGADVLLCKIARWDPDKGWPQAVGATALLKSRGLRTVLLARGGMEAYGHEVRQSARSLGLKVSKVNTNGDTLVKYLADLKGEGTDFVDIKFHVPGEHLRILYRAADAVLANSLHEPFGLVGLETMAAGGVAFTGCTGEEYVIPFVNALVLETTDPTEIVSYVTYLRDYPSESSRIRTAARRTARQFTWDASVRHLLGKLVNQARIQEIILGQAKPAPLPLFEVDEYISGVD